MFVRLILFFTIVPVLELFFLMEIGSRIGSLNTVMVILITAIVGAHLARSQGMSVLQKLQRELTEGHLPADELLDGLFVLVGGVLLLTPGFFTDFAGLTFIAPFTRSLWKKMVREYIRKKLDSGTIDVSWN